MSDGAGPAEPASRISPSANVVMGSPRFKKIRKLGAGAFGNVFLCEDLTSSHEVVAKEIAIGSKGERDDAILEAKLLGAVSHFNIIKYLDVHHAGPSHVMIYMELANDGDIDEKINQRKAKQLYFQSSTVMQWTVQLCQAVAYLHGEGFIHRDLKVANLFLTVQGYVKLGDFGIAKLLEGDARSRMSARVTRTPVGTPMYISPQVCNGEAYNQKADVWGVGCCMYEICALKPAFVARSMHQLMDKIKLGHHGDEVPFHFHDDIHDLIADLLTIDSNRRPSITAVLERPMFDRWLPGSPAVKVAAGKPPVPYPRLVDPEATRRRLTASSAPNILTLDSSVSPAPATSPSVKAAAATAVAVKRSPLRHATGSDAGMGTPPSLAPLSRSPLSDGSPTSRPGSKSPSSERLLKAKILGTTPQPMLKMRLKDIPAPMDSPSTERVREATTFINGEGHAPLGSIATSPASGRACKGVNKAGRPTETDGQSLSMPGKVALQQPDAKPTGAGDRSADRKKRQPSKKHCRNKSDGTQQILLSSEPALRDEVDPSTRAARKPHATKHRRNKSDGAQQAQPSTRHISAAKESDLQPWTGDQDCRFVGVFDEVVAHERAGGHVHAMAALPHKAHRQLADLDLRGGLGSPALKRNQNQNQNQPKASKVVSRRSLPESQLLDGLSTEAVSRDSPTQGRTRKAQSTTPTSGDRWMAPVEVVAGFRRERLRSSSFGDGLDQLGRGPAVDTAPLGVGTRGRTSSWDDGLDRAARVPASNKLADLSQFYRPRPA